MNYEKYIGEDRLCDLALMKRTLNTNQFASVKAKKVQLSLFCNVILFKKVNEFDMYFCADVIKIKYRMS